jgi:azurin
MRLLTTLTLAAALAAAAPMTIRAQTPRVIRLTGGDTLTYSLPTITAKPGEALKVVLRTLTMQKPEQLAHNFVLLKPTVKVDAFIMNANLARNEGYLPATLKSQTLVSTEMAAANEEVTTTFKAPLQPGRYPYVCTFPGHYSGGMKGVLVVQ